MRDRISLLSTVRAVGGLLAILFAISIHAQEAGPPKELTNAVGMKLVRIPAGKFVMGAPVDEQGSYPGEKQHEVTLTKPFYMGIYEVTQRQYEQVLGVNPARFNVGNEGGPDHPVEQVSWADAANFCDKLSKLEGEMKAGRAYRLPTEAEWEYACRAGTKTIFHYGDTLAAAQACFDGNKPYGKVAKGASPKTTAKVGSYAPNAFGLYDMHGNVWEWCADWYDGKYYQTSPKADPPGPETGKERVLRGGAWSTDGERCRSAYRYRFAPPKFAPNRSYSVMGFRVVCL